LFAGNIVISIYKVGKWRAEVVTLAAVGGASLGRAQESEAGQKHPPKNTTIEAKDLRD
jgi:hypothetical protein